MTMRNSMVRFYVPTVWKNTQQFAIAVMKESGMKTHIAMRTQAFAVTVL